MNKPMPIHIGEDGWQIAKRKARYGHRDWFVWRNKAGILHAALATAETCKAAMLATGTQGRFVRVTANDACYLSSSCWYVAVVWFKNLEAGY